MLDPRYVSEHFEEVRAQLQRRGFGEEDTLRRVEDLGKTRRALITQADVLRSRRNEASKAMAQCDKASEAFERQRADLRSLGDEIKAAEQQLRVVEEELADRLLHLPNLPSASAPPGLSEESNTVVRVWGEKPSFAFSPRDHVEIGTGLGLMDFERAAKISGSRFVVLIGQGARLERSLIQFMLDLHTREHGYLEVWPPVLITDEAMRGTGQLPKFEEDAFRIARDVDPDDSARGVESRQLYLAPTAEVPLTNLHAQEIFEPDALPLAYTAYTPCFRSEAGSYGRDTRGMIRQHQFDKVELVRFCRPEQAPEQLEMLTAHAEAVLQRLELHYRVIEHCAGDLGFAAHKGYDLEVWVPSQDRYREISSCSWFTDFQARRASIRFRPESKAKPKLVHTLNGSALAVGRTVVALLEQYQTAEGHVRIPSALQASMGSDLLR